METNPKIRSSAGNVLIGITGGIAAYKIPLLIRMFVQKNYSVKVIMTENATQFVTPETISVLSKNSVYTSFFNEKKEWNNHIHLADWADVFIIAPATAHTLAKIANGYCDNLLLATYLSYTKKIILAPAMDAEMWESQAVQENIIKIKQKKNHIVLPVEYGELASGIQGWGRMLEPEKIFNYTEKILLTSNALSQKKILITAGATYEPIDPVRFIGNRSSGKTGIALAEAFAHRNAQVYLIYGNINTPLPHHPNIITHHTPTAQTMHEKCLELFPECNAAILSAAVADYSPVQISENKIKKSEDTLTITLKKNPDILQSLGKIKQEHQLLIGFALETEHLIENARKKMIAKNADVILANICTPNNPAFNTEFNEITILYKNGNTIHLNKQSKYQLAENIIDIITPIIA